MPADEAPPVALTEPVEDTAAMSSFEAWMKVSGITWNAALLELRGGSRGSSSGAAWGVFARSGDVNAPGAGQPSRGSAAGVQAGDLLCTIPVSAVLSVANSSLSKALHKEKIGGGLALVAAVIHEASLGPLSPWHGYLCSLPPREYVPVFWTEAELQELRGTELQGKAITERDDMRNDFEMLLEDIVAKHVAEEHRAYWTLEHYMVASSWVASRSFYVDRRHTTAMVPLADVFNHKAAVVSLAGEFQIAELDEVEGEEDGAGDKGEEGEEEEEDGEDEGEEEEAEEGDEEAEEQEGSGSEAETSSGEEAADAPPAAAGHHKHEVKHSHATCGETGHVHGAACHHHHDHGERHGGHSNTGGKGDRAPAAPGAKLEAVAAAAGGAPPQRRAAAEMTAPAVFKSVPHGGGDAGGDGGGGGGQDRSMVHSHALTKDGVDLQLEIAICFVQQDGVEVLEVVAACDVPAGAQVHNTYGELGNSDLVHKYGFALRENPFNEVRLSKADVVAGCQDVVGKRSLQRRIRFLQTHSDLMDEEEEPFCILPNGRVNPPLFAALCVLCVADAATNRWTSVQEAIDENTGDASVPVPVVHPAAASARVAVADAARAAAAAGAGCQHGAAGDTSPAAVAAAAVTASRRKGEAEDLQRAGKRTRDDTVPAAVAGEGAGKRRRGAGAAASAPPPPTGGTPPAQEAEEEATAAAGPSGTGAEDAMESFAEVPITPGQRGWTPGFLVALRHCLVARSANYPASLAADMERLALLQAQQSGSEHTTAERAALTLRVTEQEILAAALVATGVVCK